MGHRLSKIYTRTGDEGTTALGDGARVPKDHLRVEAYGTVDEANSAIGLVLAAPALPDAVRSCLVSVQHDLFDLGGELCIPGHRIVTAAYTQRLEDQLDAFNEHLPERGVGDVGHWRHRDYWFFELGPEVFRHGVDDIL